MLSRRTIGPATVPPEEYHSGVQVPTERTEPRLKEPIRILMVDDSRSICLAVRELLSDLANVEFVSCNDPTRALETARACRPSVILQDVDMPNLNGYDLLRTYRKTLETKRIPVIMHTARGDSEDKAKAFSLGASDYLVKHEDSLELKARLLYHGQRYQAQKKGPAAPRDHLVPTTHEVKVLMVDDSLTAGLMVTRQLQREKDVSVRYCRDAESALQVAMEYMPTVIVQGILLGNREGFDLLARFRGNDATRDVPVIVLSASTESSLKAEYLARGANDFVEKSGDLLELISRIRSQSSNYYSILQATVAADATDVDSDDVVRVLMVDDSVTACLLLANQLASERNVLFDSVSDPTRAIDRARKFHPTVILLDVVMPVLDGMQLLQEFRENPATADVPIIVLSDIDRAATKGKAFALGANDYMGKDVDKIELVSRVQMHSQGYRNSKRLQGFVQKSLEQGKRLEGDRNFIKKTFGQFVSDEIAEHILEAPDGRHIGGEKREITVLMSDLRGFTAISEGHPAERVIRVLNNYLGEMTEIIQKYDGTIDEFIGDSILAMFGAPRHDDDHPRKAVACALEMQLAMARVNDRSRLAGLPEVEMGIALNTGEVVVGNIGSEKRTKYGAVGRHVNLTSRMESYSRGGQILVSASTRDRVGDVLEIRGEITAEFKGSADPVTIFDVGGLRSPYELRLPERSPEDWRLPATPVPVCFRVFAGKSKRGPVHMGAIAALTRRCARIESPHFIAPFEDVEVRLVGEGRGGIAQAKVVPEDEVEGRFTVQFSWFDDVFRALIESVERGARSAGDGP